MRMGWAQGSGWTAGWVGGWSFSLWNWTLDCWVCLWPLPVPLGVVLSMTQHYNHPHLREAWLLSLSPSHAVVTQKIKQKIRTINITSKTGTDLCKHWKSLTFRKEKKKTLLHLDFGELPFYSANNLPLFKKKKKKCFPAPEEQLIIFSISSNPHLTEVVGATFRSYQMPSPPRPQHPPITLLLTNP